MRELHFLLKNSARVNLINFTKEGSNNYKYVFEQGNRMAGFKSWTSSVQEKEREIIIVKSEVPLSV